MKRFVLFIAAALLAAPAGAKLRTKVVEYKDGDVVLQGYAAWDDGFKDQRPGVLVVHEWWGHGPYARRRAEIHHQRIGGSGVVDTDEQVASNVVLSLGADAREAESGQQSQFIGLGHNILFIFCLYCLCVYRVFSN